MYVKNEYCDAVIFLETLCNDWGGYFSNLYISESGSTRRQTACVIDIIYGAFRTCRRNHVVYLVPFRTWLASYRLTSGYVC